MKSLLRVGLAIAAIAVTAAVVVSVSAQGKKEEKRPEDARFEVRITGEMVRHSRIVNTLYFVGTAWSFAGLAIVLGAGISRRLRDLSARVARRPFLAAMLYIVLFSLVIATFDFPLTYYAGYSVPHRFDLSDQSLPSWMADQLKGLAVSLAIGAPLGALALLGIRRLRRWWVALWLVSIPLILLMVVIQPIVLDPIFNRFEPLRDQVLREKLLDLASHAGIEGSRVYQVDKSKQTKTMNAYVNGIGPTNRIVMWDTLLAKLDHAEVLGVMAHEMGHYALRHIWKGLAFSLALSFFVFFLVQRIHDWGLPRFGPRWGFTTRGDPASLPWLLLIASVIGFLLSPVVNCYSRSIEHNADIFALELTRRNEPLATAFVKLAEDSKRDPNPDAFIEFWRYSHPPIGKRIAFALSYRPWETGEPNRLWRADGER